MALNLNVRMLIVFAVVAAAVVFMATSAFAQAQGGTRPGWGFGDKNHVHTGPPGLSVRP